jgi:hypothetical protein
LEGEVEKLIIDRKKWFRGHGAGTLLVSRKGEDYGEPFKGHVGEMCCLGFECLRQGYTDTQLGEHSMPVSLFSAIADTEPELNKIGEGSWLLEGGYGSNTIVGEISRINDDEDISEEDREARLTALFAKCDIEVEFVN